MSTAEATELTNVLNRVKTWPTTLRITLAHCEFRFLRVAGRAIIRHRQYLRRGTAMRTTTTHARETEVTILARILGNGDGQLPRDLARYIVELEFSDRDKARMHDLAVRNQDDALSAGEKEEMFAFGKAGTLLSILQSKARRTLKIKPKKRTPS